MKKVLPIIGVSFVAVMLFASCSSRKSTEQASDITVTDTSGLAEFQAFQKQKEFDAQYAIYKADMDKTAALTKTANASTTKRKVSRTSYPAKTTESVATIPAEKKKGWSKAAKGAAIGGASGAILGGVIAKNNRVLGAVIGGVAGAGAGYGIGRSMDKKDGRIK